MGVWGVTVGGTMKASDAPRPHHCTVRPYNILELALHGVPGDVFDVLFEGPSSGLNVERPASLSVMSVPATVAFLTPTSARRCLLTVVGGPERWSVARFSTVWPAGGRRLPSEPEINCWNEHAPAEQKMTWLRDGSILLCLDVDLDDITLHQVIPLWRRWDQTVETARDFVAFGAG